MAELTTPIQCGTLRIGDYMMINDHPCKILDAKYCKTGKHGTRKGHFFGEDIFTGQKMEYLSGTTKNVDTPNVMKADYQLVDITDDTVSYLDADSNCLDDLVMPHLSDSDETLAEEIRAAYESGSEVYVSVLTAMDVSAIKGFKINK